MSQLTDSTPTVMTLAEAAESWQPGRGFAPVAAPAEQQEQLAPLWPVWHPEASGDAHYRRVVTLAALLNMTRGLDLPQIATWDLSYERPSHGQPSIRGQLGFLGGDQQRREAVAAWAKALHGHTTIEVWDDGQTRIAAQCQLDGVLIEVWALLRKRVITTAVPAVASIEAILGDDVAQEV